MWAINKKNNKMQNAKPVIIIGMLRRINIKTQDFKDPFANIQSSFESEEECPKQEQVKKRSRQKKND